MATTRKAPTKVRGVYEREPGSGVWWICYKQGTVRKREKVGSRGAAMILYRQRKTELRAGAKLAPNLRAKGVTLGALIDRAILYSKGKHKDQRTITQRLERVRDAFGERVATEITAGEIDEWLSANTKTGATANRYRAAFSLVYNRACKAQTIAANPARLVDPRKEAPGHTRVLSGDEERTLRSILAPEPHQLGEFVISIKTGMRLSEQYEMRWSQVDLKRRIITLPDTKNGQPRAIPMAPEVFAIFSGLVPAGKREGSSLVFRHGKPRTWFGEALERAGMVGDKAYRWHANRHTFCTRLAENKAAVTTIQKLAGHKTISMSARYTHASDDTLAAEIAKLG